MSRIYDALKKAEQEKQHTRTVTDLTPAAPQSWIVPSASSVDRPPVDVAVPATAEPNIPLATGTAVADPSPATPTALCPQPETTPDVNKDDQKVRIQVFPANSQELHGAEELRRLRTKLQHAREKAPFRSLMITSPLPGEGKTFITANLAHALTMQYRTRVLVIDADLRKPHVHVQFGIPNHVGLADYLEGACDFHSVLRTSPVPSLHVITGGRISSRPAELAGSAHFAELLTSASEQFDWVLVDTSPIIPVTDAALLARLCDATLLVVDAGETSGDIAQAALKELKEANLIGVVLNRAARSSSKYNNYYYKSYSSGDVQKTHAAASGA